MSGEEGRQGVVRIYSDGACSGNPGPGGWGVLLQWRGHEKELSGGEPMTTNNRMELMAAISALESLKRPVAIDFYVDSQYVRKGITEWIAAWKANNWRTAGKKPVKNEDLWRRLDALAGQFDIRWHWVKGHADNEGNTRADALARQGLQPFRGDDV